MHRTRQNDFRGTRVTAVQLDRRKAPQVKEHAIATFQAPPWCPSPPVTFFRLMMTGAALSPDALISPPIYSPETIVSRPRLTRLLTDQFFRVMRRRIAAVRPEHLKQMRCTWLLRFPRGNGIKGKIAPVWPKPIPVTRVVRREHVGQRRVSADTRDTLRTIFPCDPARGLLPRASGPPSRR